MSMGTNRAREQPCGLWGGMGLWGMCMLCCGQGGQRTIYRNHFSPSTVWILEIKLRSSGFPASSFIRRTVSVALHVYKCQEYLYIEPEAENWGCRWLSYSVNGRPSFFAKPQFGRDLIIPKCIHVVFSNLTLPSVRRNYILQCKAARKDSPTFLFLCTHACTRRVLTQGSAGIRHVLTVHHGRPPPFLSHSVKHISMLGSVLTLKSL